ncbi:MAG: hypothetical protein ACTSU5_11960 [Promethearchaeota archaeon]
MDRYGTSSRIEGLLDSLRETLGSDEPIDLDEFQGLAGKFSSELNALLREYHGWSDAERDAARPLVLYLRQVQHYLVFLLRFPDILAVPHHCEIQQVQEFLANRDELLAGKYAELAGQQKGLFAGPFRQELERCLGKRFAPE